MNINYLLPKQLKKNFDVALAYVMHENDIIIITDKGKHAALFPVKDTDELESLLCALKLDPQCYQKIPI